MCVWKFVIIKFQEQNLREEIQQARIKCKTYGFLTGLYSWNTLFYFTRDQPTSPDKTYQEIQDRFSPWTK